MTVTSVEQTFAGKLPTPQGTSPLFSFAPPQSFSWLEHFDAK